MTNELDYDMQQFILALDNDSNNSIMKLSLDKIKQHKQSILSDMMLSNSLKSNLLNKLKNYRYCSEMSDLSEGNYIRWISLKYPDDIKLTRGAYILDVEILKDGIFILCRGVIGNIFRIKFDECIIFQKITNQEFILLNVLKHLDK
tara:strand:- start:619 stop:1056 length:438 start_codon:yes stop_codon:yes gene_type:complete